MIKRLIAKLRPWIKGVIQLMHAIGIGVLRGLMYSIPIATLTSVMGPVGFVIATIGCCATELAWLRLIKNGNWRPLAAVLPATAALPAMLLWTLNPWLLAGCWIFWVAAAYGLTISKEQLDKTWGELTGWFGSIVTIVDIFV